MAKKLTGAVVCGSLALFLGGAATAADLIWAGDGTCTGKWDKVSANWKDQSTGLSAVFTPGDNVTFVDAGNASNVITIVDKSLEVGQVTFSNENYMAFEGGFGTHQASSTLTSGLYGSPVWKKYGKGVVFLNSVSSFTGDIHIVEGTLRPGKLGVDANRGDTKGTMLGTMNSVRRSIWVHPKGTLDLTRAGNFAGSGLRPLPILVDLRNEGGVVDWGAGWRKTGEVWGEFFRWHNWIFTSGSWITSEDLDTGSQTGAKIRLDGDKLHFGGKTPWTLACQVNRTSSSSGNASTLSFGFKHVPTVIDVEDITGDDEEDVRFEMPVNQAITWQVTTVKETNDYDCAFVKTGKGTLTFAPPRGASTFTGNVEIVEGTLNISSVHIPGNFPRTTTPMGNCAVSRKYTVRDDGRLFISTVHVNGDYGFDKSCPVEYEFLGGTLGFATGTTIRTHYALYAPNKMLFEDAKLEYFGGNGLGFGRELIIQGTTPFVITNRPYDTGRDGKHTYVRFGLNSQTTDVSVADVTGDGKPDAVFDVVFANGSTTKLDGNTVAYYYGGGTSFTPNNFRKTGAGTMRVGPLAKNFIGDAHAGEGTLLLDCDLATDDNGSAVFVEDGAYLGGCGQITRPVRFESGAGLEVATSQGESILELDDLNLVDGSGKVQVVNDTEIDPEKIKDLPVARVALAEGSAPLDVSRWSGRVAGTKVRCRVDLRDGVLYASATKGLTVIVR